MNDPSNFDDLRREKIGELKKELSRLRAVNAKLVKACEAAFEHIIEARGGRPSVTGNILRNALAAAKEADGG